MGRAVRAAKAAGSAEKRRRRIIATHLEFESVASSQCVRRWVEKGRAGVQTHVIELVGGGLLRLVAVAMLV